MIRSVASTCRTRPVVLFITYETCGLNANNAPLFWLARQVGFRPFVVPWDRIDHQALEMRSCSRIEGQTIIRGGFEALANGGKRQICSGGEQITPQVIFHRIRMEPVQERLYERL